MVHPAAPTTSITLLGDFTDEGSSVGSGPVRAIVRIEKTPLDSEAVKGFFSVDGTVERVVLEGNTDIYTWLFGWLGNKREEDIKISIVCPATDVHIRKYTKQEFIMVKETPEHYETIVKPYIQSFPASRTQWVEDILLGLSEGEKILYSSPDFLILPDMKWDRKTVSSLYLLALVQDRTILSLRDLRKKHIGLLNAIRCEGENAVKQNWGLPKGSVRMYVHYQPSYYHFHVHIVNANSIGFLGMAVGQAHLLDDIISLLEIEPDNGPGIFEKMTLTYGLGNQHGLYEALSAAN